jgi:group I intron endonuclease
MMEIISGIYKIRNIETDNCYIGLSRNIYSRWRQHTSQYYDSILSRAFKKYGLTKIITSPGVFGNFEFKIIEECPESLLQEREKYWIDTIKPAYNCLLNPRHYDPTKQRTFKRIWMQYHNFEKNDHIFPSSGTVNSKDTASESSHYISTKKTDIKYSYNDEIYMLVGLKGNINKKGKDYFLWSKVTVETIDFLPEEELEINAFGHTDFIYLPEYLNNYEGFDEFRWKCGNFAFGLTSIEHLPFLHTLEEIFEKRKLVDENIGYGEFIKEFIKKYQLEI